MLCNSNLMLYGGHSAASSHSHSLNLEDSLSLGLNIGGAGEARPALLSLPVNLPVLVLVVLHMECGGPGGWLLRPPGGIMGPIRK